MCTDAQAPRRVLRTLLALVAVRAACYRCHLAPNVARAPHPELPFWTYPRALAPCCRLPHVAAFPDSNQRSLGPDVSVSKFR